MIGFHWQIRHLSSNWPLNDAIGDRRAFECLLCFSLTFRLWRCRPVERQLSDRQARLCTLPLLQLTVLEDLIKNTFPHWRLLQAQPGSRSKLQCHSTEELLSLLACACSPMQANSHLSLSLSLLLATLCARLGRRITGHIGSTFIAPRTYLACLGFRSLFLWPLLRAWLSLSFWDFFAVAFNRAIALSLSCQVSTRQKTKGQSADSRLGQMAL